MKLPLLKILAKSINFLTVLIILMILILIGQIILFAILDPLFAPEINTHTDQPQKELSETEKTQFKIANASKEYSPEGTLYLINPREPNNISFFGPGMSPYSDKTNYEIYDSSLNLLWSGKSMDEAPFQFISSLERRNSTTTFQYTNTRLLKDKFIVPAAFSADRYQEHWLFDYDKNYFTGYDINKNIIGYCSSVGFTDSKHRPQPLKSKGYYCTIKPDGWERFLFIWQTEHRLYQIDFTAHSFAVLFEYDKAAIINTYFFQKNKLSTDLQKFRKIQTPGQPEFLVIRTTDNNVFLIRDNPYQVLKLQMPAERFYMLSQADWAYWEDRVYLLFEGTTGNPPRNTEQYESWVEQYRNKPTPQWKELYHIEKDGRLSLLNRFEYMRPVTYYRTDSSKEEIPLFVSCTTSLDPILFRWISSLKIIQDEDWYLRNKVSHLFQEFINAFHPHLPMIAYPVTLLFMTVMLYHFWPRRTSWVKGGFWLGVVFLFNAAGFLTYLALNHSPVIRCHCCQKRRGLNRLNCPSCGAALPTPHSRPIDIINPPSFTKAVDIM